MKDFFTTIICLLPNVLMMFDIACSQRKLVKREEDFDTFPPMWENPCGAIFLNKTSTYPFIRIEERSNYKRVEFEAKIALEHINALRTKWLGFTFHKFFYERLNEFWYIYIPSSFLPDLRETHKLVDGPIPKIEYNDRDEIISNLIHWLQRVALGMEQLVRDQIKNKDICFIEFGQCYRDLRLVLCQLEHLRVELEIPKQLTIERALMSAEEREPYSNMARNVRDYTIFREYINMMQYTVAAMNELENLIGVDIFDVLF